YMAVPVFEGERIVATAGVGNKNGKYDVSDVRQLTLLVQGLWRLIQRRDSLEALKKYAEDLEHSNELKELFSDIMRHDLLNPAGIVKGYTDLLLEMEEDEKKHEIVLTIDRNNKKLIDMIENAARFARLDNFEDIEFQRTDLANIIESVIGNFSPDIEERQMIVEFGHEGEYPVKANPMVEDVFSNLLSNAIKYSSDSERIIIDISDAGDEWKVSVTDFGEGVPDENKPELFQRFKRVTKKGIKGTGLGLAIVKKIIDLHGGTVGVEDNPEGRGSIFWVTLDKWD
ncbi:MAG: ATP-binding protein, partial [Halobacteriota archaeon]